MKAKNLLAEVKEVIKVEVTIDEKKLSDKLFEKAVDPLMLKLVEIIPSEFDNVFYAAKKQELKDLFLELLEKGVDFAEEKTGIDLDGKDEAK